MRTITSANAAEIAGITATAVDFIELQFSGGTIRLTTAPVNIVWNALTWQGTGFALRIGPIEETMDNDAQGARIVLSGVDQSIIAILLAQNYRGRIVNMWRGWFNPTTGALVDIPLQIWSGFMNEAWEVSETYAEKEGNANTCEISTRIVSRLTQLDQHKGIQCNLQSHARYYGGDLFYQFVPSIMGLKVQWPNANYQP